MTRKVAVVTGSNKGLGYAIVKGLCEKFDGYVYLTSRDEQRGKSAAAEIKALGFDPIFYKLDITDQSSIDNFKEHLKTKYGGIDVLVNNAAIAFKSTSTESMAVRAKVTIETNYYGTLRVCDALFPLLRKNGRVVNISSSAGHSSLIASPVLRSRFIDKNISLEDLNNLMETFVRDAAEGKEEKWAKQLVAYVVSKVGISCLTIIQQKLFDSEMPNRNIAVNSVHPGLVITDLASELVNVLPGAVSIEEGAKAPLFLALEADFKGKYVWKDCSIIDWYASSLHEQY